MAITLADFTKIWASTSPLTPYSFSESNYKEGWNFIGSTPPARQMWDSIQKQNDEKLKYIVDNYLPLAGGTMLAPIGFNAQGQIGFRGTTHTDPNDICKQVVVTAGTVDSVWNDGNAKLCLHTYDDTGTNTAEDGGFTLQTSDGTNAPYLEGKPNGDLKWNGKSIERVNASGSDYIRFESGLQICWGRTVNFTTAGTYTVTLPVAFANADYKVVMGRYWIINQENYYFNNDRTTTTFQFVVNGNVGTNGRAYDYIAVGYWK